MFILTRSLSSTNKQSMIMDNPKKSRLLRKFMMELCKKLPFRWLTTKTKKKINLFLKKINILMKHPLKNPKKINHNQKKINQKKRNMIDHTEEETTSEKEERNKEKGKKDQKDQKEEKKDRTKDKEEEEVTEVTEEKEEKEKKEEKEGKEGKEDIIKEGAETETIEKEEKRGLIGLSTKIREKINKKIFLRKSDKRNRMIVLILSLK